MFTTRPPFANGERFQLEDERGARHAVACEWLYAPAFGPDHPNRPPVGYLLRTEPDGWAVNFDQSLGVFHVMDRGFSSPVVGLLAWRVGETGGTPKGEPS